MRGRRKLASDNPVVKAIHGLNNPVVEMGSVCAIRLYRWNIITCIRVTADVVIDDNLHPRFYRVRSQDNSITYETGVF